MAIKDLQSEADPSIPNCLIRAPVCRYCPTVFAISFPSTFIKEPSSGAFCSGLGFFFHSVETVCQTSCDMPTDPVDAYRIAFERFRTFLTACCPMVGAIPVLSMAALSEAITTPSEQRMPTMRVIDLRRSEDAVLLHLGIPLVDFRDELIERNRSDPVRCTRGVLAARWSELA